MKKIIIVVIIVLISITSCIQLSSEPLITKYTTYSGDILKKGSTITFIDTYQTFVIDTLYRDKSQNVIVGFKDNTRSDARMTLIDSYARSSKNILYNR